MHCLFLHVVAVLGAFLTHQCACALADGQWIVHHELLDSSIALPGTRRAEVLQQNTLVIPRRSVALFVQKR